MKPTREQLRELLRSVSATQQEEIDCDEFLARVGALLERRGGPDDLPRELQRAVQHLDVCPECREEFDALVELHLDEAP